LSLGLSIALEAGVAVTVGGGPGRVDTGLNGQLSCSAGPYYGGMTSDGISGTGFEAGFNVLPAQLGCNAGGSYTF
jgi:hypothetical protein